MKYIICIGDGMADWPIKSLGNKTPLDVAETPALDTVVRQGKLGTVMPAPETLYPGSDVANMGILGYDPLQYYTGRAPIEAASIGVHIPAGHTAFRCNLVHITDGIMTSFTADHIQTDVAAGLIQQLNQAFAGDVVFHVGTGYRHSAILPGLYPGVVCTPPHDITDKPVKQYLPSGPQAALINDIMTRAVACLADSGVGIWLWSQGTATQLPTFKAHHNLTGGIISAVDVVRGLGVLADMTVVDVPGATGFIDTNYTGKFQAATQLLATHDLAYIHIEAPDECGHLGDSALKIKAIADFDQFIVGPAYRYCQDNPMTRLMILPDHPTPCEIKTHSRDPVPVVMAGHGITPTGGVAYTESDARQMKCHYATPMALFNDFIR